MTRPLQIFTSLAGYALLFATLFLVFFLALLWLTGIVVAQTPATQPPACPPPAKSCKLLMLTPDEEQALTAPNQILHTAEQGRFIELTNTVKYFRDKIRQAPQIEAYPEQGAPPIEHLPAVQPPK